MSLRTRLIAALIVLTAGGLVTLAPVTYPEQRSFLFENADNQARDAERPPSLSDTAAHRGRAPPPPGPPRRAGGPPPPGAGGRGPPPFAPPPFPRGDDEPGPGGGSGPQGLERGTYGELRDRNGNVISK